MGKRGCGVGVVGWLRESSANTCEIRARPTMFDSVSGGEWGSPRYLHHYGTGLKGFNLADYSGGRWELK